MQCRREIKDSNKATGKQSKQYERINVSIKVCNYVGWHLPRNKFLQYHICLQQGYVDFSDVYQVPNMLRHILDETMLLTGISYVHMHYFSSWLENVCNIL